MEARQERIESRIKRRLRTYVDEGAVDPISAAILKGEVVRLQSASRPGIVAFKHGVLFVAGTEYVIADE